MVIWTCPNCGKNLKIDANRKALCVCGTRYTPNMPTLPARLWHFTYALYRHVINGMPTCTEEQIQGRLDVCKECPLYTGTHCSHESCGCNINGMSKFLNKLAWADQVCPIGLWGVEKPEWITTAQLTKDIFKLTQKLDSSITSITGISRSGLIVGSQIASYLHLPLYSLDPFSGELVKCGSGYRLQNYVEQSGYTLIVDDSVNSYYTMREAKELIKTDYKTAVVYVSPGHIDKVDYYVRQLAPPHYFEWHFFNSYFNDDTSYDLDGVICDDVTLMPKYLPRNKPVTIITHRLEQFRESTIAYLNDHGVQVKELIMSKPEDTDPAEYKARHITTKIYVESDIELAKAIKKLRPTVTIICPTTGEVL